MVEKIGILHPGQMGISVAASARRGGSAVYWASEGRSLETHQRARSQDLEDLVSLNELCRICTLIISVCPPHAAEELAERVLSASFQGLYLDANAISPQRVARMAARMTAAGVAFVDGGIIGGPAWQPGETWLYLSGQQAERVTACFVKGPLETEVIGSEPGQASALKMCYAAYTKGSTALLCTILAAAEALGIRPALENQWQRENPGFPIQVHDRTRRVTTKAWRFTGEMEEISATFSAAGMPGGFHQAAAEVYCRMSHFKGMDPLPDLNEVLRALLQDDVV